MPNRYTDWKDLGRFDWDAATDAERLAWCRGQLAKVAAEQAKAKKRLDAAAERKLKAERAHTLARDEHHTLSERIAGLNGHVRHLTGELAVTEENEAATRASTGR